MRLDSLFKAMLTAITVLLVAVVWLVLVIVLDGCHGTERATRTALDVSAHALAATDSVVAVAYREHSQDALAAATSLDDYHARMARFDRTEEALRATRESLLAAERAVDAGTSVTVASSLACVRDSVVSLGRAMSAADVRPPESIRRAIEVLDGISFGACVGDAAPVDIQPSAVSP